MSGRQAGWLFERTLADGRKVPVSYNSFFNSFHVTLGDIVPEAIEVKFHGYGPHMLRRTGISLHICNDKDETQIICLLRESQAQLRLFCIEDLLIS